MEREIRVEVKTKNSIMVYKGQDRFEWLHITAMWLPGGIVFRCHPRVANRRSGKKMWDSPGRACKSFAGVKVQRAVDAAWVEALGKFGGI